MRNRFPRFFLTRVVVQNVSLRMTDRANGSDRRGDGRVCACATGSCAISALVEPFDRKCPLRCCIGRPRPISSMATGTRPFTGYLHLLFSYNIIYFNNGFHLRCFRIGCVVLQVVYHIRIAFLLYFLDVS